MKSVSTASIIKDVILELNSSDCSAVNANTSVSASKSSGVIGLPAICLWYAVIISSNSVLVLEVSSVTSNSFLLILDCSLGFSSNICLSSGIRSNKRFLNIRDASLVVR